MNVATIISMAKNRVHGGTAQERTEMVRSVMGMSILPTTVKTAKTFLTRWRRAIEFTRQVGGMVDAGVLGLKLTAVCRSTNPSSDAAAEMIEFQRTNVTRNIAGVDYSKFNSYLSFAIGLLTTIPDEEIPSERAHKAGVETGTNEAKTSAATRATSVVTERAQCKFYPKGKCTMGSSCMWRHTRGEDFRLKLF